jgi:hypothetical protein
VIGRSCSTQRVTSQLQIDTLSNKTKSHGNTFTTAYTAPYLHPAPYSAHTYRIQKSTPTPPNLVVLDLGFDTTGYTSSH